MRKDILIDELTAYISLKLAEFPLTEGSVIFDDLGTNGIDANTLMENPASDFDFSLEVFDYGK